jgi:hypothetical protein
MKKFILLAFTILTTTSFFAQGIDFGIKAGVNFATITDASNLSNKTGFVGGVFAGIKFNDKVAIQGDLLYSQQGADFDIGAIDLNYVNIPVVLKYFFVKGLNLQVGPQFGFVVDDNFKEVFGDISKAESFDLTGVVGVGYDLPLGIRIDGRYNFGLTDVIKDAGGKNTVITLSVGYSFL